MISKEDTLKTLRLFQTNAIRGRVLEFIFYFKRKLTYLPQAIFFLLAVRFVQTGLVNANLFVSFAFLKELLTLELRVCTEKLVSTPFKTYFFTNIEKSFYIRILSICNKYMYIDCMYSYILIFHFIK